MLFIAWQRLMNYQNLKHLLKHTKKFLCVSAVYNSDPISMAFHVIMVHETEPLKVRIRRRKGYFVFFIIPRMDGAAMGHFTF